jgi:hypothetical protein
MKVGGVLQGKGQLTRNNHLGPICDCDIIILTLEAYTQEDSLLALNNIKQQGIVAYYSREFHQASLLVENTLLSLVVAIYIDRLNESIKGHVNGFEA